VSLPKRGEVWLADLGFAAKTRPVLVVSVPFDDSDYALLQVVPHTTQKRAARFQVELSVPFLEDGMFNVQGMTAVPAVKFLRRLGVLSNQDIAKIESALRFWLGLK
jgi:mRNA interferase MazF